MFGAFGNSAGMLLFACSVALKTLCASIVFSLALTSRAGGVVINSRFLGHNESPFLELCYTLLLALQCQGHKPTVPARIPAAAAYRANFGAPVRQCTYTHRQLPPLPFHPPGPAPPAFCARTSCRSLHFCYCAMFTLLLKQLPA